MCFKYFSWKIIKTLYLKCYLNITLLYIHPFFLQYLFFIFFIYKYYNLLRLNDMRIMQKIQTRHYRVHSVLMFYIFVLNIKVNWKFKTKKVKTTTFKMIKYIENMLLLSNIGTLYLLFCFNMFKRDICEKYILTFKSMFKSD